jgi:poly-beta-1,6-N-acetyl-D-glucosamine synthase
MRMIFWMAVAGLLYTYLGYPLLLAVLRLIVRRPVRRGPIEPTVCLVIPAYNEAAVIQRKIRNALELEYPGDRLEIMVASDGSTDDTVALAWRAANGDSRVRVLAFSRNRGKMATLSAAVLETHAEIVVFSDAPAVLRMDALRSLVENFADPEVGAASGRYTVMQADEVSAGASEEFYWKYETFLKSCESDLGSTLGAHGHLYAIRRELYPFPDSSVINDDYVIPMSVLSKNFRAVYDRSAVVSEEAREMGGFGRRVRVVTGNIQQLAEIRPLLRPFRPLPLFFFLSHKVGRLVAPIAMLVALAANLGLASAPLYRATLYAQAGFYLLSLCGVRARLRPKFLMLPFYFSMLHVAVFFGFYHALTHRRSMAWE